MMAKINEDTVSQLCDILKADDVDWDTFDTVLNSLQHW